MLGIVPAAGRGSRIQPLGFSKELLPVGSRIDGQTERPCAVSEYLVRRMVRAGVDKICFIIGSGKSDILEYYAAGYGAATALFVVQPTPVGLCDAIFRAAPLVAPDETVLIGLPDTIWFPEDGFCRLPDDQLSFLLFPVERPEFFDAVVLGEDGRVREIQVKREDAATNWIWGAFKMPGHVLHRLAALWRERDCHDEYIGTLINAHLAAGGQAYGVKAGAAYVDVGTFNGYRAALRLLDEDAASKQHRPTMIASKAHSHVPAVPGEGA
ncbi:nucleotidyltransferase family protein [Mesorhizobium sp. BR1-1-9]|uniref:sugar phosphate nucleotidyltransferase n=1 Tax=unclassified Mesorhizobium TaxID=325217 RepID=UPI00112A56C4|nr:MULTISPECIES: sugar phosphate nucleotidyltransferase [unclassified Mesorhizobium]MBZ9811368.1 nucleotidyltransferase family protein [Mesorhizobium sp. ESP-6-2]MBZ9811507.1 nucleotidyltransferase family protein [Mesorhizobium sp. ESP-6-2]MBZ9869367.1 nucleotidyltransferase family protein [Mesorhizobium sp. BR1-1-9]MBZ9940905.1 nucleotidyltransferase family protein [Mesorhizobium sp. BR1-1-13]TPM32001.1 nucleotidyltransferase family protein [Mesorhizobium sp. B2-2-2]